MEEIKAFKTTDGEIFEDKQQAEYHEKECSCKAFVGKYFWEGMPVRNMRGVSTPNYKELKAIMKGRGDQK